MVLPSSDSSLDDEPYFRLFTKSEAPLISLICPCTACSFSLFFRLSDLPPFRIQKQELYPIIQCQKASDLSDEHVLMLCQILLNVELTDDNLESWQYDSFTCYDDLMEFAYSSKFPIARYHNHVIYYDGYFDYTWMDLNVVNFERYHFSAVDGEFSMPSMLNNKVLSVKVEPNQTEDIEKVTITQNDCEISNEPLVISEDSNELTFETPQDQSTNINSLNATENKDVKIQDNSFNSYLHMIKQVTGSFNFQRNIIYLILLLFGKKTNEYNNSHSHCPSGIRSATIVINKRAYSFNKVKMKLCQVFFLNTNG